MRDFFVLRYNWRSKNEKGTGWQFSSFIPIVRSYFIRFKLKTFFGVSFMI